MTASTTAVVGVVASCDVTTNSDQSKLDGASQANVLQALGLQPSQDSAIPAQPADKIATVNGLENVVIKITKWTPNTNTGVLSFTATLSKEGLVSKDIKITTSWKSGDTPPATENGKVALADNHTIAGKLITSVATDQFTVVIPTGTTLGTTDDMILSLIKSKFVGVGELRVNAKNPSNQAPTGDISTPGGPYEYVIQDPGKGGKTDTATLAITVKSDVPNTDGNVQLNSGAAITGTGKQFSVELPVGASVGTDPTMINGLIASQFNGVGPPSAAVKAGSQALPTWAISAPGTFHYIITDPGQGDGATADNAELTIVVKGQDPIPTLGGRIDVVNDSTDRLRPLWHVDGMTTIITPDELNKQLNALQTLAHFSLPAGGYGVQVPRMLEVTGTEGHANIAPISDPSGLFTLSMQKIVTNEKDGTTKIVDLPNIADTDVKNGDQVLLKIHANDGSTVNGASVGIYKFQVGGLGFDLKGQTQQVRSGNSADPGPESIDDGESGALWNRLREGQATLDNYDKTISLFKQGGIVQSKLGQSLNDNVTSFQIPTSLGDRVHAAKTPMPNHVEAPFLDITTAHSTVANYNVTKYPYATLAFSQLQKMKGWNKSTWGGSTPMFDNNVTKETANSDYIGLINKIRDAGGDVALSFGGVAGKAFWEKADPVVAAAQLYDIVKEYKITRVDYDIETTDTQDKHALDVLGMATALVQQKIAADAVKNPGQWTSELQIQITAATDTDGMTAYGGLQIISTLLENGVNRCHDNDDERCWC
ncbi:MAG: hypothetical protein NC236_00055 [Mycoplasma sp.]|nr:hypothetical protein [Mycoplasma sp.]